MRLGLKSLEIVSLKLFETVSLAFESGLKLFAIVVSEVGHSSRRKNLICFIKIQNVLYKVVCEGCELYHKTIVLSWIRHVACNRWPESKEAPIARICFQDSSNSNIPSK